MPMYEYRCVICSGKTVRIRRVVDRDLASLCGHCTGDTDRVIFPHQFIQPDIAPYRAVSGDRRMVASRSQHREYLNQFNLIEVGDDKSMAPPPDEEGHPSEGAPAMIQEFKQLEKAINSGAFNDAQR